MFNFRTLVRSTVAVTFLAIPIAAQSAEDVSVVLVHGAFSNGSAWNKVIPILQDAGVDVAAAQLPLSTLKGDADVVSRLIDIQDGPVVLVGHSYGGTVITEAGAHEDVASLVYVAGFALDAGQSLMQLLEGQDPAPWLAEAKPDEAGYIRLTAKGVSEYFAPDLTAEETALMTATQGPLQYKINYEAPSVAAWSMKPTSYVIAENDQIVSPDAQGYFAQKMGADVTKVPTSHVAMLAQPDAVAQVILDAVEAVSRN